MSQNIPDAPPPYIRTVYDETHRGIWFQQPSIMSIADRPNLLGHLEHHAPTTDGSFAIAVASGQGSFVSQVRAQPFPALYGRSRASLQALYESIPEEHRPPLDLEDAGRRIRTLVGGNMVAVGSTFFPFILTDAETGERMRYVLRVLVVPKLLMGMFISGPDNGSVCVGLRSTGGHGWRHQMKRLDGTCWVQGM